MTNSNLDGACYTQSQNTSDWRRSQRSSSPNLDPALKGQHYTMHLRARSAGSVNVPRADDSSTALCISF